MTEQPGTTREQPLYFKWVTDEQGIRWDRVMIMLGLTVLTAYLSVRTQRLASGPDLEKTIRMTIAQKQITLGTRIQRAGRAVEEAGWQAYEKVAYRQ